jgi:cysteine-rich repeat protein
VLDPLFAEQCDDGLGNSDTVPDACRTSCERARCGDGVTDSGEECDDANLAAGDGCSAGCATEACVSVAALPCGAVAMNSSGGPGSTNVTDDWLCAAVPTTGPELVYTFVPDGPGIATVELTGLSADLDLLVIREVGGACAPNDAAACVPGAYGGNAGTADERVQFDALAGETYFVIVDGVGGATSTFTLTAGTAPEHLVLDEVHGANPTFVELLDRGACDVDLDPFVLRHQPAGGAVFNYSFPPGALVAAGGVFRMVEAPAVYANESSTGGAIADASDGSGWTMLCLGLCDVAACTNVRDYLSRAGAAGPPAGAPACASFSPAPFDVTGLAAPESVGRNAFDGAPLLWLESDWAAGTYTRN